MYIIINVIQSEAKNLGYIHVDVFGILRHFVPLNDKMNLNLNY